MCNNVIDFYQCPPQRSRVDLDRWHSKPIIHKPCTFSRTVEIFEGSLFGLFVSATQETHSNAETQCRTRNTRRRSDTVALETSRDSMIQGAYMDIAMSGHNFWEAAYEAEQLADI